MDAFALCLKLRLESGEYFGLEAVKVEMLNHGFHSDLVRSI